MERIGKDSGVILEAKTPELSFGTDVGSEREKSKNDASAWLLSNSVSWLCNSVRPREKQGP